MENKKKSFGKRSKKNSKNKLTSSDENARYLCDCEATKHPLVNNCINCGRIICLSEGPGPCFFCGHLVTYNNELVPSVQLQKDSNEKYKFPYDEIEQANSKTLELRDKLLEFDKNCASRTSVIDDECDYYQANNLWLTKQQREQWKGLESNIREQKHKSRLNQRYKVDLTGRICIEEDDPLEIYNKMNSIQDDKNFNYGSSSKNVYNTFKGPVYMNEDSLPSVPLDNNDTYVVNRIQDKHYLEISDQGVCLSMHQPWASLLVKGIKKTEGRTWYTSHRGRLWIAAAAKQLSAEEIKSIEDMHRLTSDKDVEFPKDYPTGCLIGCVNVTDVLSQEEFKKLHPDALVESPYLFICENPFELPMKFPMQGKHKIYKLEPVLHKAALNTLERACLQMSSK